MVVLQMIESNSSVLRSSLASIFEYRLHIIGGEWGVRRKKGEGFLFSHENLCRY